jgi:Mrp family chromosome partitioning ATPase
LASYLAKYREATARDNIDATSADARIISRATVSNTPAFPKKLPTVIVAALAMFVLSTGVVATSALLRGAVFVPPQGAEAGDAAVGAGMTAAPVNAVQAAPGDMAAARLGGTVRPALGIPAERLAATVGQVRGSGDASRRVTVVGAARVVGTTLAATSLARALAVDSSVVLVDLALASPNLSVISSEPQAPGLAELVRGTATFSQIITRDRFSRVHLVMAGFVGSESEAIYRSQRLDMVLDALARTYDHVIVDAGPLDESNVAALARIARYAVLVVHGPEDSATASARERLRAAGFADVSVLIEGPPEPANGSPGNKVAA